MKKAYYLKTCDTCKRIIKSLPNTTDMVFQDIKENPVNIKELEDLYKLSGSYEKLFSKRAKLYKERGLKDEKLTESDFKSFILEHYTFLNRPVFVVNDKIFIGNSVNTIQELIEELSK